jgi:hypothetical protein
VFRLVSPLRALSSAWLEHLLYTPARDPRDFTEIVESRGLSRSQRVGEGARYTAFVNANVHTNVHTPHDGDGVGRGCTICRTCRFAMPDSAVPQQRENGIEQRE